MRAYHLMPEYPHSLTHEASLHELDIIRQQIIQFKGGDDVSATCSRSTVIIQYSCASAAHCYGVSGLNTQWIYQRVYGVRMFVPMSANLENMILSHPRPLVTSMFHRAPYQFVVC